MDTVSTTPDSPTFTDLGVRSETVDALAAIGITHAFAIQQYALPIALRGSDLIGQAPTGTGKTLGFGIPLLQHVLSPAEGADGLPQALVVVPTRELGLQVARDIAGAGKSRGVRVLPIYGGVAYEPQTDVLRNGVEILVSTPGRLLDLAKSRHVRLDRIRALVLDEADRMLDLGFLEDVEKILAMLPEDRQTMLFSATMPDPIVALARRFLRSPVSIHASHDAQTAPSPLTRQVVYRTHPMNKIEVLARILQARGRSLTMIFTRTKRSVDRVAEDLDFRGFAVAAVHGDLGQGARERALRAFRVGKVDVLVATDVAARGLDVSGVTHVINYDCPEDADTYVHRVGRTGRAGATGVAVTFVDWEDMPRWRLIDKSLGLDLAEPPETYHTSPTLYTDLDIPTSVTGTLPAQERTRAGLAAEVEEDLGGGRSRRRSEAGRRGRSRRGEAGGAGEGGRGDEEASTQISRRQRRRRRSGVLVRGDEPQAGPGEADSETISAAGAEAPPEAGTQGTPGGTPESSLAKKPRRRRRSRAGSGRRTAAAEAGTGEAGTGEASAAKSGTS